MYDVEIVLTFSTVEASGLENNIQLEGHGRRHLDQVVIIFGMLDESGGKVSPYLIDGQVVVTVS